MGRPYQSEMAKLPATYAWGLTQSVDSLSRMMEGSTSGSAICIGSGGSYSAAVFCAEILESVTGKVAIARTPLEIEASPIPANSSVWLLSGSGRNVDIRRALKLAARQTSLPIFVVCAKTDSPLEREARDLGIETVFCFDSPAGKDGYLATNSLLATCVLLTRAAENSNGPVEKLPRTLPALYENFGPGTEGHATLSAAADAMATASYIVVLHGPSGRVGAVDLESKFIEAAIAPLAPSDYRNFAHGRHNWLNRYGHDTYVLALIAENELKLGKRTLDLLPEHVACASLALPSSRNAARLISLLLAFEITALSSTKLNLDPGRPKIPEFGRKLYGVRTGLTQPRKRQPLNPAIQRKLSAAGLGIRPSDSQRQSYVRAHEIFLQRLQCASVEAVVLDYDGTLVATEKRELPPSPDIAVELNRLLAAGLTVGIATGRGDSVRAPLQQVIESPHHGNVLIGYHNGAVRHRLNESPPTVNRDTPESASLLALHEALLTKLPFLAIDKLRPYRHQLSLRGCSGPELRRVWSMTNELIASRGLQRLKVLTSGHSVDVLDSGISKSSVLEQLAEELGASHEQILCIGDSGYWPGNDLELLSAPLSLSVDRVSVNPNSCWNLLPSRVTHVDGTLYYLRKLTTARGKARMIL